MLLDLKAFDPELGYFMSCWCQMLFAYSVPVLQWGSLLFTQFWYLFAGVFTSPFGVQNLLFMPILIPIALFCYSFVVALGGLLGGAGIVLVNSYAAFSTSESGTLFPDGMGIGAYAGLALLFLGYGAAMGYLLPACFRFLVSCARKADEKLFGGDAVLEPAMQETITALTVSTIAFIVAGHFAGKKKQQ